MTFFCYKKLAAGRENLGTQLRQTRAARCWTLAHAGAVAGVPEAYIQAIEKNDWAALPPARAYRLAYVRHYTQALGMDATEAERRFKAEGGLAGLAMQHPFRAIRYFPFHSVGMFVRSATAVVFVGAFIGYLAWQVSGVVKPPRLEISYPSEGALAPMLHTVVDGATEPESKLTVNGAEVMVSPSGQFNVKVDLVNGLNTIIVEASKKHGRTTTITRHIIAQPGPVAVGNKTDQSAAY